MSGALALSFFALRSKKRNLELKSRSEKWEVGAAVNGVWDEMRFTSLCDQ